MRIVSFYEEEEEDDDDSPIWSCIWRILSPRDDGGTEDNPERQSLLVLSIRSKLSTSFSFWSTCFSWISNVSSFIVACGVARAAATLRDKRRAVAARSDGCRITLSVSRRGQNQSVALVNEICTATTKPATFVRAASSTTHQQDNF